MKIIESNADMAEMTGPGVLTIGNFDGVHLGHQEIIKAVISAAAKSDSEAVAMTFDPHPVAVLHPERTPQVLTPLEMKKNLLAQLGLDRLVIIKDTYKMLTLSPQAFVDEFLCKHIKACAIVEGTDFNFGYGRSGNVETLKQLGQSKGFEVVVVEPRKIKLSHDPAKTVSSTLIRHLLQRGNVTDAAKALGRNYRLIGKVTTGRGKGKEIGFPTANIDPTNQIIPDEGVYAGFVEIGDCIADVCVSQQSLPAVFSIGRAKTFITDTPLLIEAHVLDRDIGDVCGQYLAMDFAKHLRHQQRFDSEKELSTQITKDCKQAKEILNK